jgi:hypothetical protein
MVTGWGWGLGELYAHLGCQADYFPPPLHPQVRADDPTNARAQHLALVVQQHRRVVVEAHQPTVGPSHGLPTPHDDRASHVATSHLERVGNRLRTRARTRAGAGVDGPGALDDADDLVADAAPAVVDFVFEHVDALYEERARVVYYLDSGYVFFFFDREKGTGYVR